LTSGSPEVLTPQHSDNLVRPEVPPGIMQRVPAESVLTGSGSTINGDWPKKLDAPVL
jgi:hypothetical protein